MVEAHGVFGDRHLGNSSRAPHEVQKRQDQGVGGVEKRYPKGIFTIRSGTDLSLIQPHAASLDRQQEALGCWHPRTDGGFRHYLLGKPSEEVMSLVWILPM